MNTGFMREGVVADDRLIRLNLNARNRGEQAARRIDFLRVHAFVSSPSNSSLRVFDRHHDFFKARIARAFADSVHRAFDLTRSGMDRREGYSQRRVLSRCGNELRRLRSPHLRLALADIRSARRTLAASCSRLCPARSASSRRQRRRSKRLRPSSRGPNAWRPLRRTRHQQRHRVLVSRRGRLRRAPARESCGVCVRDGYRWSPMNV